jgi:predicted Zn-dependent protease
MLMLMPRMILQQELRAGHHANALFVRCAQALSMPEGRAERAVEALAQSIDGAEHGAMLKGVLATALHQGQNRGTSASLLVF